MTQHKFTHPPTALVAVTTLGLIAALAMTAAAQTSASFNLSWSTVDQGGATAITSPNFRLSGTVGQQDPGFTSSASTGLEGGFWSIFGSVCCTGDLNNDGAVDGDDVNAFVNCIITGGGACGCAEFDGMGGITMGDLTLFVNALLAGTGCP